MYAHRDAIGLLGRALRNAPAGRARLEALRRLGDANRVVGRLTEAQAALREALAIAEAERAELEAVAVERRLLMIQRQLSLPREELEAGLRRVLERAQKAAASAERCHLLWLWSNLPGTDPAEAVAHCTEALSLADASGDAELRIQARYALGRTLALVGADPRDALVPLNECLDNGDRMREAGVRNVIAIVHVKLGNYRVAAREFDDAARTFDEIGDPGNEAAVLNNLAVLLTRLGEWDAAEQKLAESLRIARRMGAATRALQPLENRAVVAESRGDMATALERWSELTVQAAAGGWWNAQVIGLAGAGRAHLALGERAAARAALDRAASLLPPDDASSEASIAWHHLAARIAAADGDVAGAMRMLDVVEPALARSDRYEWAAAQVLRAELLADGDAAAAANVAAEALAILEQLDTGPVIERARAVLQRRTG
jgi:tetratricopeptide (TPR) repeat protein